MKKLPLLLCCLLCCLPHPVPFAEENSNQAEIEARLKQLEAEISDFRERLENAEGEKSEVERTLEQNEKRISNLIKKVRGVEEELNDNENKVATLKNRQAELVTAKQEQQGHIERQVRAAWETGNQEYLKVLLNQEDPDEIARMLVYYDYFNKARADQIKLYNRTLAQLEQVSLALADELTLLRENQLALNLERQRLAQAQKEKQATLNTLIARIKAAGSEITRRQQDRSRLEQLLSRLQSRLANIPIPGDATPFSEMRGKLLMPVKGRVAHRFGQRRNQGRMKWQGVLIDAPEGDPVYAVHYGRVVFSDWLRGFGLLLIISHGDGYMSLYGHNQVLYRETGDWVAAGHVVATVGDSGGQNRAGLYFEIRIDGKPSDPQQWCLARPGGAA